MIYFEWAEHELQDTPEEVPLSILGFWPDDYENEWGHLNEHELQDTPKEAPLSILGFWPDNYENEWYVLNEHELQDTPKEAPLRFEGFGPMIMRFTLFQFLWRGISILILSILVV